MALRHSRLPRTLRGLLHVLTLQQGYEAAGHWSAAQDLIRRVVADSYLGEMLREVRSRLDGITAGTLTDAADVADEKVPAEG